MTAPPYNADPTGVLDAAPAINQALLDQNNAEEIVYLPAGTYRLSGKVEWGDNGMCQFPMNSTCQTKTVLAGAGVGRTILRLDDDHPDFQTTASPRGEPLVNTGSSAAMHFRNALRHMTISTGSGNPAATAVTFMASNHGGVSDVRLVSEDGQGKIGLNMFANEQNGPLLVQDVEVEGFDIGVNTFGNQNSITFERITVRNQNVYGVFNQQHPAFFRELTSVNDVTAVFNQGDGGSNLTLIDSDLRTVSGAVTAEAITNNNRRQLFVRNTTTSGYGAAIRQRQNGFLLEEVPTGYVEEYTTAEPIRACDNVLRSLNLPIVEAPVIDYADTSTWVSIEDFGATVEVTDDQPQGGPEDDTQAIRAALNSGAETIVIPSPGGPFPARYTAYGDLVIPPTVKHIIGAKGFIGGSWRFVTQAGTDTLTVEDFVKVEAFAHESARTVHFRSCVVSDYTSLPAGGSGDVFFEDVNGGPFLFHQQTVYARQLNPEIEGLNILNDGGTLWILGIKIEKKGTMVRTINGGRTEVLGAFAYATIPEESPAKPLFEVVDASLSVAGLKEITYIDDAYDVKLRETRNGVTQEIRDPGGVVQVDLLVAYPSDGPNAAPTVTTGDDQLLVPPAMTTALTGVINDDAAGAGDCFTQRAWTQVSGPAQAAFAQTDDPTTDVTFPTAGTYVLRLTADDGASAASDEVTVRVFDNYSTTLDHDQDGQPSGRGADAQLFGFGNFQKNYGGGQTMIARNAPSFPIKSLVRIDRGAFSSAVETAALELEVSTTNAGLIEAWTYNVFGLDDANPGESWVEGTADGVETGGPEVTYENAPGNLDPPPYGGAYDPDVANSGGALSAETTFLGTFQLRRGRREKVALASPELAAFVNADTDGQLTFLITRVESTSNAISFATKENAEFAAPRLYFDFAAGAALPVTLVRLSAKPLRDAVEVAWASAAEEGVRHYEVQRRGGGGFRTVGTVAAHGDGDYRYLDAGVGAGRHYYRLRSVDEDGTAEVSEVVTAVVTGASGLVAYPNPVAAGATLTVAQPGGGAWASAEVRLVDALGRTVARVPAAGTAEVAVPTAHLAAGVYYLEVAGERRVIVLE